MRVRYGAMALPTVAMGASLLVGCNPSNEENLGGQTSKVVPHKENSEIIFNRYQALGGPVERIVKTGGDHHPHGLSDPAPIVDFFAKAWGSRK